VNTKAVELCALPQSSICGEGIINECAVSRDGQAMCLFYAGDVCHAMLPAAAALEVR